MDPFKLSRFNSFSKQGQSPGFLLWQASQRWKRSIEEVLRDFCLTLPQFVILATVGELTKEGRKTTQADVGRQANLDPNTTSQILRSLESRKLVQRAHEHDERSKHPKLTVSGSKLLNSALPAVDQADTQFFSKINLQNEKHVDVLEKLTGRTMIFSNEAKSKRSQNMHLFYQDIRSPIGKLRLVAHQHALVAILWENEKTNRVVLTGQLENKHLPILQKVETELSEYFRGNRTSFHVPIEVQGSPFQIQVWNELKNIPYGTTAAYMEIAERIGKPQAVRAVGAAIGRNPLSIVIPCHRVIGKNKQLTGFAGGLEAKNWLLQLEGHFNG